MDTQRLLTMTNRQLHFNRVSDKEQAAAMAQDYEQHAWLGRGQLRMMQEPGHLSDEGNAATTATDTTATSASTYYQPDSPGTPNTHHRRTSCTDSGFMPWSQDIVDKESLGPHSLLTTGIHQSVSKDKALDQDPHTPATWVSGMCDNRHPLFNPTLLKGCEEVIHPRVHRPVPLPPTTPQYQGFFSPSPSPSDYTSTRALLGLEELFAPSQTPGSSQPLEGFEGMPYPDDSSPLGTYFRERSQSADRMPDPGLPTRYLKVSNVNRKMSIWVARDAFKSFGDLRGIFTSFLLSHGVIFLEFFDIRHAMIASKRLYSSPAFENAAIKVHFCQSAYISEVLPESHANDNDGIIAMSLQAPILTVNDLLRFLSSFGEIRYFQKEYNGWPPVALVEYYDTRHAASALSALREMHRNNRIQCQASFYQKNAPIGVNDWQQQQSHLPIGYRMTRTNSTPGDIMYPSAGAGHGIGPSPRPSDQTQSTQSGSGVAVQRPIERTPRAPSSSSSDRRGFARIGCDVVENNGKDEPQLFRRFGDSVQSHKRPINERSSSPSSQAQSATLFLNTSNAQRDVDIPLAPNDKRTTFMIRNIPNKYTQSMLLECINETHFGEFDFLYLRMDFKNKCNVGYAFINFINTEVVTSFVRQHVGKRWGRFNSDKICNLSYATIQGRRALIDKFRNSSVMEEEPSYRPKIFYTSGPHLGQEEPFPGPTVSKDSSRGHGAIRRRTSAVPHSDA
ncbi:hypothetical protein EC991_001102 [Linnemannia zychae]|nr:hypothetical protein EC991_001102 [Linnemannia zychae]